MSNTCFVLRADANSDIGYGHVSRMISLYEDIQGLSFDVFLLLDKMDQESEKWIKAKGIDYQIVNKFSLQKTDRYSQIVIILDIDHKQSKQSDYDFTQEENTQNTRITKVAFADLSKNWTYSGVDLLVYPYFGYNGQAGSNKVLHGSEYFLLRSKIREGTQVKLVNEKVEKITISMGGSNPNNSIEYAIELLSQTQFQGEVYVIVGPSATINYSRIDPPIRGCEMEFHLVWNTRKFESYLTSADIIFTNDGLTKYESLYLGIPTITITSQENNAILMEKFAEETKIINLGFGFTQNSKKVKKIDAFINSYDMRNAVSKIGKKLIDGKGSSRLIKEILQ